MDSFDPNREPIEQNEQNEPNKQNFGAVPSEPMFERSATGSYNEAGAPMSANNFHQPPATIMQMPMIDPVYHARRRSIFNLGNIIGLPLCLYFIGAFLLVSIIQTIMALTFGTDETNRLLFDPNVLHLVNAVLNLCLFTVPFVFAVSLSEHNIKTLISFKSKSPTVLAHVMTGLGVCAVGNFGTHYLKKFLDYFLEKYADTKVPSSTVQYGEGTESFLIGALCVGILPALLEEFAFRGVILGLLRTKLSDGTSIVISAVLFGMIHGNLKQMPFAFIVGLALGYSVVKNGSLLPAILIHLANNMLTVVSHFAKSGASPLEGQLLGFLIQIVMLLVGLCGFIMLIKTDKNAFKLSKNNTDSVARDVVHFASSPWILGYTAFVVLSVLDSLGLVQ